jgi:hypothetical protein
VAAAAAAALPHHSHVHPCQCLSPKNLVHAGNTNELQNQCASQQHFMSCLLTHAIGWTAIKVECYCRVTLTWNSRGFGAFATGIRNFSSHLGWNVRSAIEVYLHTSTATVGSSHLHTSRYEVA